MIATQDAPTTTAQPQAKKAVLAIDNGNGSLKWSVAFGDEKAKTGSVPNLILETPHPAASSVDGETFAYGVLAAKLNLSGASNPGKSGSHKGKTQHLSKVLAAAAIEASLIEDSDTQVDVSLRVATPLNCQIEGHKDLVGQHLIRSPKFNGTLMLNVVNVKSYQECRPLLAGVDAVVDCGSGTTFYGWNDGNGQPVIRSLNDGVGYLMQQAVDDCRISERFATSEAANTKGVLSPEGLAASLASGKAVTDDGIFYKGIQFADVLKPLVRNYWIKVVKPCISQAATNAVPRGEKTAVHVVGGGSALLQALLSKQELENTGLPDNAFIKFARKPATQLVAAMVKQDA